MNWNQYQQQALTTAVFPVDRSLDYTVFGLCSEVGELAEVILSEGGNIGERRERILSESGDCWWYSAAIADALDVSLDVVACYADFPIDSGDNEQLFLRLVAASGNLAGAVKKAIRDNEGHLTPERREYVLGQLNTVVATLDHLAINCQTTRYAVWAKNLNKLQDRKQRGVLQGSGDHR